MYKVLDHTTREARFTDDDGNEHTGNVIHSINFLDINGSLRGFTFHPRGTIVSGDAEDTKRVVGDDNTPEHVFTSTDQVIEAVMRGEL